MNSNVADIHFSPEYARVYEEHEGGNVEVFQYKSDVGSVSHLFIKRALSSFPGFEAYSDIITPYGYGGPIIVDCAPGNDQLLVQEYNKEFGTYCSDNKIVSSFVRFHPVFRNDLVFSFCYDEVVPIRKIVITDMTTDIFYKEFSRSIRRAVFNAENEGISIVIDPACSCFKDFLEIYYGTMDNKKASDYYYFNELFFQRLITDSPENVFLSHAVKDHLVIASVLCLEKNGIIYGQFGGTRSNYYHLQGYSALLAKIMMEYAATGRYTHFVLGGGVTNDPCDSILQYKQKFSKDLHDFYIGKCIYDPVAYSKLCDIALHQHKNGLSDSFFPAYRKR